MDKPDYLDVSVLEIRKTGRNEFWYHYVKKIKKKQTKLCCMDIESFVVKIKTEEIYLNIAKVVETRFDTSSYQVDRRLPKGKKYSSWINER